MYDMPVSSSNVTVMLSGSPKPGEAIRAVLLGDLNLNLSTVEFQWYKKEYNQENREPHRQPKKSDHLEELSDDEFEIHGATAPIYLVRKVDIGCHIGVLVIFRSNSRGDFEEERKKESNKILGTFKSEMIDMVHLENDEVDEDYYGDDVSGEQKTMSKIKDFFVFSSKKDKQTSSLR
jgi:hypothetical protein